MGWNSIEICGGGGMFDGIDSGTYFYFDHSFFVAPENEGMAAAKTDYGRDFVSAVSYGKIWGVQFHPEKSAGPGLRLLENFVKRQSGKNAC